uniref:Uncharacterized protein n=1 Tax=Acrobeloides nanus TaxID=290746 RepID=A0A914CJI4_9BILA
MATDNDDLSDSSMDVTPIFVEEGNERNDSYFEALTDCNSNDIWSFAPPETSSSIPDSQKVEYVREMELIVQ